MFVVSNNFTESKSELGNHWVVHVVFLHIIKPAMVKRPRTRNIRNQIFISYSHKDQKWLEKLQIILKPLVRDNKVSLWDDTKIQVGTEWKKEIEEAITRARVAVLLVSPEFLASDFIANVELPPLLNAAQKNGLTIMWIPIRPSLYKETAIQKYQAAILNPEKPLARMKKADQDQVLVQISELIKEVVGSSSILDTPDSVSRKTKEKAGTRAKRTNSAKSRQKAQKISQIYSLPAFATRLIQLGEQLEIINIGNISAINIRIETVSLQLDSTLDANIAFERLTYLRPGEPTIIKHISRFGDEPTGHGFGLNFLFHLKQEHANGRIFPLRIEFQDVVGRNYTQTIKMGAVECGCEIGPVESISA